MRKNFTLFNHHNDSEVEANCEEMFNANEKSFEPTLVQLKNIEIEAPQMAIGKILSYANSLKVLNSTNMGKLEVLIN